MSEHYESMCIVDAALANLNEAVRHIRFPSERGCGLREGAACELLTQACKIIERANWLLKTGDLP